VNIVNFQSLFSSSTGEKIRICRRSVACLVRSLVSIYVVVAGSCFVYVLKGVVRILLCGGVFV
jgi:hypothetical protein